jgi:hypothetical protein
MLTFSTTFRASCVHCGSLFLLDRQGNNSGGGQDKIRLLGLVWFPTTPQRRAEICSKTVLGIAGNIIGRLPSRSRRPQEGTTRCGACHTQTITFVAVDASASTSSWT